MNYDTGVRARYRYLIGLLVIFCLILVGGATGIAGPLPALPADVKLEPPAASLPPAVRQLAGIWEGEWQDWRPEKKGSLKTLLAVEKIDGQQAQVVYAVGDCPDWQVEGHYARIKAQVAGDDQAPVLSFTHIDKSGNSRPLSFTLTEAGTLKGRNAAATSRSIEMRRR